MRLAVLTFCFALAGCSANADGDALSNMVVEDLTAENLVIDNTLAASEAAAPEPRYIERDGDTYFYVAAVSEEDQKKGRAAGSIMGFRYLGKINSVHRLEGPDGSSAVHECAQPCRVIKTHLSSGIVTRMEFTPSSIIGAAFTDAFNGFLKPVPPPRTAEAPPLSYERSAETEIEEADAPFDDAPSSTDNAVIMNTTEDY